MLLPLGVINSFGFYVVVWISQETLHPSSISAPLVSGMTKAGNVTRVLQRGETGQACCAHMSSVADSVDNQETRVSRKQALTFIVTTE